MKKQQKDYEKIIKTQKEEQDALTQKYFDDMEAWKQYNNYQLDLLLSERKHKVSRIVGGVCSLGISEFIRYLEK